MKQLLAIAISLCMFTMPCLGQEAGLKPVAPVLRDGTVAVIYVDMKAVAGSDAFFKQFTDISNAVAGKEGKVAQDLVRKWLDDFVKAGGTSLYIVLNMQGQTAPLIVVPLAKGADVGKMAAIFEAKSYEEVRKAAATQPKEQQELPGFNRTDWEDVYIQKDGSFIFGMFAHIRALGVTQPAQRADLAKAFAAASQAPVRAAFVPPAAMMAMLPEKMPTSAPAEGLGIQALKKVSFVTGAMTLPPITVNATVATADAQAAKDVEKIMRELLAAVAKKRDMPLDMAPKAGELPSMVTIAAKGDEVKVSADAAQSQKLINDILVPALQRSRQMALRFQAMGRLRNLGAAFMMYVQANGRFPKDLQELVKHNDALPEVLKNPLHPELEVGWVYIRPAGEDADFDMVMVHEKYETWPKDGVIFLKADYSAGVEKDQAKFKEMVAKAQKASK